MINDLKKTMYDKYAIYMEAENAYKKAKRKNIAETYIGKYIYYKENNIYMHVTSVQDRTNPITLCGPGLAIYDDYVNYNGIQEIIVLDSDKFDDTTNMLAAIDIISVDEYKKAFDIAVNRINHISRKDFK